MAAASAATTGDSPVAERAAAGEEALPEELVRLGKELQCPICLCILQPPTARLPCCHYFCLDCINESLKHKTACPSCKLFARKRDVMRDFKIDRVATLYAQLEAASGQFVFCSPASRPAANAPPPQPAAADAAAAAFVVPSPPDSEFETAREDFGNAAEAPAFRLWAASPADAPAALTQDSAPSGAPPLLSQPPSTAARRQPPPSVRPNKQRGGAKETLAGGQDAEGAQSPLLVEETPLSDDEGAADPSLPGSSKAKAAREAKGEGTAPAVDAPPAPPATAVAAARGRKRGAGGMASAAAKKTAPPAKQRQPRAPLRDIDVCSNKPLLRAAAGPGKGPPTSARARRATGGRPPATPAANSGQKLALPDSAPPPTSSRRVPTRLQPWACHMCTLENAGTAKKCAVCDAPKLPAGAARPEPGAAQRTEASAEQEPECPPLELERRFVDGEGGGPAGGGAPGKARARKGPGKAPKRRADAEPKGGPRGKSRKSAAADAGGASASAAVEPPVAVSGPEEAAKSADKRDANGGGKAGASPGRVAAGSGPAADVEAAPAAAGADPEPAAEAAPQTHVAANVAAARRSAAGGKKKPRTSPPAAAPAAPSPASDGSAGAEEGAPAAGGSMAAKKAAKAAVGGTGGLRWERSMRGSWILLSSGLEDDMDRENLHALAAASGAQVVGSWGGSVTHVVCHVGEDGRAKRTAKYMHGILEGAWVVSAKWMTACLLAGGPVPEKEYEVVGDTAGGTGGPRKGRARREANQPKLLSGKDVVLHGSFSSREAVKAIVTAAGGHLLTRIAPAAMAEESLVVICESKPAGGGGRRGGGHDSGAAPAAVCLNWLMDSVGAHQLRPMERYRLQA
eukprot:jgi/Tetstr1/466102/TSEL_000930.t1